MFIVKSETSRSHEIDEKGLHEEPCSSVRSGHSEKLSGNIRVKQAHDETGQPVKRNSSSAHIVKRSHGVNDQNLIQKIENHPQRQALQSDLQQHRQFNPSTKESPDVIKAAGNTELCEILDVEPKAQCKVCLSYWDVGIVYCTCGHFLRDDTTEKKKYIKSVLDLFSIPNFYIRKGRPHGHRYGKKEGDHEYFIANQLKKKCKKRDFSSIHDRFIRDARFRKTMIEMGRTEEGDSRDGQIGERRSHPYCHRRRTQRIS